MGNEFVMVPREDLANAVGIGVDFEKWSAALEKMRSILARQAEQHQGEPVAPVINAEQVLGAYQFASFGPANHLRGTTNWCAAFAQELNHRIGADTAEVERIGKELREVREERDDLRRRVDDFQSRSHGIKNLSVIEQLNDKLAERDALLRDASYWLKRERWAGFDDAICKKIDATLSASAEPSAQCCGSCPAGCVIKAAEANAPVDPGLTDRHEAWVAGVAQGKAEASAPVERDERADFEVAHVELFGCQPRTDDLQPDFSLSHANRWRLWQARAALERKPPTTPRDAFVAWEPTGNPIRGVNGRLAAKAGFDAGWCAGWTECRADMERKP